MFKNLQSIALGLTGFTIGIYYLNKTYNKSLASNHPTTEYVEAALKLDKRVSNYCGTNYKIKSYQWIEENENQVKYRFRIEGIRGDCKVSVKCDLHSHLDLVNHSKDQMAYSKKTKNQKAVSTFIPYNFNDILIPTTETLNKMKEILKIKQLPTDILTFNKEKYINGDYNATKEEPILTLNTKISDNDTFYRIHSIIMIANDSLIFNIRPITPKLRKYDIEDTVYNNKTYDEVLYKLMSMKFDYEEAVSTSISTQEMKNEILLQKQNQYQELIKRRKNIILFNMILVVIGSLSLKFFTRSNIDVTTLKSLQSKISSGTSNKLLGQNKKLLFISYNYSFLLRKYYIKGIIFNDNGQFLKFSTTSDNKSNLPHNEITIQSIETN
jgi:hypothetical protein